MILRTTYPIAFLLLAACGGGTHAPAQETWPPGGDHGEYTLDDFRGLATLIGSWRVTVDGGSTVYQSYRSVDDSTFEAIFWTDSTMRQARYHFRYHLRHGVIGNDAGGRLMGIDSGGYHFVSQLGSVTFRRVSPDRWRVQPRSSTGYAMDRLR